jgi:hypothetical protein
VWLEAEFFCVMQEAAAFMQDHPLGEENPQINDWNGGLGSEHKKWLAHVLSEAARYNCNLCFDMKLDTRLVTVALLRLLQ